MENVLEHEFHYGGPAGPKHIGIQYGAIHTHLCIIR